MTNTTLSPAPMRGRGRFFCLTAVRLAAVCLVPLIAWSELGAAQQRQGPDPDVFGDPRSPQRAPRSGEADKRGKAAPKDGKSADAPPKPIPRSMRPPGGSSAPTGGAERAKLLAELYAYLATAEDEEAATRITNAIEHVWLAATSDTVNLLMERARRVEGEKKPDLALRLLDRAAQLAPDQPEVFNRRAALYFSQNNVTASIGDLRRVLALEPNHYRALEALGQIFKDIGQKKAALAVYRKLYEIHPMMSGAKTTLEELEREVAGQPS